MKWFTDLINPNYKAQKRPGMLHVCTYVCYGKPYHDRGENNVLCRKCGQEYRACYCD